VLRLYFVRSRLPEAPGRGTNVDDGRYLGCLGTDGGGSLGPQRATGL